MEGNKESLEERIERIRLRNEELEKKHRAAEEDRIRALKDNAMVEVKSPKHEDWPKQHKYDTLDFTYDLVDKEKEAEEATGGASAVARKKKTFSEGGGPPPDPVYNFLADSERDGDSPNGPAAATAERKRSNNNYEEQSTGFRKNGSFRRQNSSHSNHSTGAEKGKGYNSATGNENYRKPLQFDQQPKKNLETNWRTQPRDNEKTFATTGATTAALPLSAGHANTVDDAAIAATYHQKKPSPPVVVVASPSHYNLQQQQQPTAIRPNSSSSPSPTIVRQPLPIHRPVEQVPPVAKELVVEQRGNIQISVSKDGEIQSVKLTSARQATPGTGRVGLPRAITKQSQPPPAPAEIPMPSDVISVSPSLSTTSPPEAQNPSNHFHIPNMAYPPPPIATKGPGAGGEAKKFSVQDRLAKFQVPI